MIEVGQERIAELWGIEEGVLNNADLMEAIMLSAAIEGNLNVVKTCSHQFSPHGVSIAMILSESLFSYHSFSEIGLASFNIFTCGKSGDTSKVAKSLFNQLKAKDMVTYVIQRGKGRN